MLQAKEADAHWWRSQVWILAVSQVCTFIDSIPNPYFCLEGREPSHTFVRGVDLCLMTAGHPVCADPVGGRSL